MKKFYSTIQPLPGGGYGLKIIAERERYPTIIRFTGEDALINARSAQGTIQAMIRSIGGQFTAVF